SNFTGADTTAGSLNDGKYVLTALAGQISAGGQQLDGNGDGIGGDNYLFTDAQGLFRLFGDATGDRRVDNADFFLFRSTHNRSAGDPAYLAYLDYNAGGAMDNTDFFQF